MDLPLYIPERDVLTKVLNRARTEAQNNGCELDLKIFSSDIMYLLLLTKLRQDKILPQFVMVVDTFEPMLMKFAGIVVRADALFNEMGERLTIGANWPKAQMHFFSVYILPQLCGMSEFHDAFFDEWAAIVATVQRKSYTRRRKYEPIFMLSFPSAAEVVERTRLAASFSTNAEDVSMTVQESVQLDSMLTKYADNEGTADDWLGVINEELDGIDEQTRVFLFRWLATYGLPHIFGLAQIMRNALEVTDRLPVTRLE